MCIISTTDLHDWLQLFPEEVVSPGEICKPVSVIAIDPSLKAAFHFLLASAHLHTRPLFSSVSPCPSVPHPAAGPSFTAFSFAPLVLLIFRTSIDIPHRRPIAYPNSTNSRTNDLILNLVESVQEAGLRRIRLRTVDGY